MAFQFWEAFFIEDSITNDEVTDSVHSELKATLNSEITLGNTISEIP